MKQQVKLKLLKKTYQWKLSKREFGQYRCRYKFDMKYVDFREYLEKLYVYYLNDIGLSVNQDGLPVEKVSAKYMWAQLDITFNKEPLCVWMYQKGASKFGNIAIGSRAVFDKLIAENINNKI